MIEHKCRKKAREKVCVYCGKRMIMVGGNWHSEKYLLECIKISKTLNNVVKNLLEE